MAGHRLRYGPLTPRLSTSAASWPTYTLRGDWRRPGRRRSHHPARRSIVGPGRPVVRTRPRRLPRPPYGPRTRPRPARPGDRAPAMPPHRGDRQPAQPPTLHRHPHRRRPPLPGQRANCPTDPRRRTSACWWLTSSQVAAHQALFPAVAYGRRGEGADGVFFARLARGSAVDVRGWGGSSVSDH